MRQRLNFYASAFERSMTVAAKLKKNCCSIGILAQNHL